MIIKVSIICFYIFINNQSSNIRSCESSEICKSVCYAHHYTSIIWSNINMVYLNHNKRLLNSIFRIYAFKYSTLSTHNVSSINGSINSHGESQKCHCDESITARIGCSNQCQSRSNMS